MIHILWQFYLLTFATRLLRVLRTCACFALYGTLGAQLCGIHALLAQNLNDRKSEITNALTNRDLLLSNDAFSELENKSVDIIEILRAQEKSIKGKSTDEKIFHYKKLLQQNNVPIQEVPYKSQDYIQTRFPHESLEQKHEIARYYTLADKKSGAFSSVMIGRGTLTQNYQDGLYNRTNNVPKDEAGNVCTDTDKSGCKISGVFINAAKENGINIESTLVLFGGGFGYQKFFNPYIGTRLYGDGLLSTASEKLNDKEIGTLWYILGGMNVDLLAELPLSLFSKQGLLKESAIGVYGGIGIGVVLLFDKANNNIKEHLNALTLNGGYTSKDVLWNYLLQVDYGFNLGFSFSLTSRYKIDFGAKIPMSAVGLPSELRLGLESPATYSDKKPEPGGTQKPDGTQNEIVVNETLISKDILIHRSPFYHISFIMLF